VLDRAAEGFGAVAARDGEDANAVFGSGALTNEKAYALGKFARLALRTSRFDYNGRFCMSSAAAAVQRSLGVDRGLIAIAPDFDEVDAQIAKLFEGD